MDSNIDLFKIETNHIIPEKGSILIAEPFMSDIYFKRSIVLLTEHNNKETVGFVLNKPVNMQISDLINDFPEFDADISIGGPVSTNTVHYIHTLGDLIPNSHKVYSNIFWGGDFETVKKLIREKKITKSQIKFFLGYSGWEPKQLDDELTQNSWLVSALKPQKVMEGPSKSDFWKEALLDLGEKYKMWVNSPDNPSLN